RGAQAVSARIGAEVDIDPAAEREYGAVDPAGDLQLGIHLARVVHRHQVFAPILDPADWAGEEACRERNEEVLRIELAARAEPSADVYLDEVDSLRIKPKHACEHAPIEEGH